MLQRGVGLGRSRIHGASGFAKPPLPQPRGVGWGAALSKLDLVEERWII